MWAGDREVHLFAFLLSLADTCSWLIEIDLGSHGDFLELSGFDAKSSKNFPLPISPRAESQRARVFSWNAVSGMEWLAVDQFRSVWCLGIRTRTIWKCEVVWRRVRVSVCEVSVSLAKKKKLRQMSVNPTVYGIKRHHWKESKCLTSS